MDSQNNPQPLSESMQWQEHTGPLPLSPKKARQAHPPRENTQSPSSANQPESLPPEALEYHRMMRQLSVTLRKNIFLSQRVQSLKKDHLKMTEKNTLLQNELLKLNEKHQSIIKTNTTLQHQLKNHEQHFLHLKTSFYQIRTQLENQKKWGQARQEQNQKLTEQWRSENLQHQETSKLLKQKQQQNLNLKTEIRHLKNQLQKQNKNLHLLRKTFKTLAWQHQQKTGEWGKTLLHAKRKTHLQNRHLAQMQLKHQKDFESLKREQNNRLEAARKTHTHQLYLMQQNHRQQMEGEKAQNNLIVQQQKLKQQKEVRKAESFRLHFFTLLRKYRSLKTKWHQRIKNLSEKHSKKFSVLKAKYKGLKHQMHLESLKQIRKLQQQHEAGILKIRQDHLLAITNMTEQKDTLIKNQEAKNLSLQARHLQKEKQQEELHQQALMEKEKEFKKNLSQTLQAEAQKHQKEKQALQGLLHNKEERIQDLNHEVEHLNKNYIDYEQKLATKWEGRFVQIQIELNTQKQEELSQIQKKYERQITEQNSEVEQKWRNLKDQYDLQLKEKESSMENRIQELMEEQEDSQRLLRVEMENELIAQKRNFTALNQSQITDRDKLQKDLKQTQTKLELKSFKITHLETEVQTLTSKANSLKKHNQQLKDKNLSLQTLWEKQWPEMEQQKHQIASLRRLNRQLSLSLQESPHKSPPSAEGNTGSRNSQARRRNTLKEIHIHNPS